MRHDATEAALRESEERFRLTLDEAPIGMAIVGTDGRFLRVNRVLCELLGYSAEELTGLSFQDITHPDDLDDDLALAGQLARGEIPRYTLEKRYVRKDNAIVEIKLSGSVLRDPTGKPVHYIAQVEDISERKRVDRERLFLAELGPALESSLEVEEILGRVIALAIRTIADFCIVDTVDEQGRIDRKRAAARDSARDGLAQQVLGLALDRSRPYLLSAAIRTRQPVLVQRPTDAELAALAQSPGHLQLLRALEIASMVAVPIVAGDRLLGAIGLIASRGSREHDERDVRLAQELAWRTAMCMENARLYGEARRANRVRDEVLAIVAHDLRNPLATISMQATLLRRRRQPRAGTEGPAGEIIQRAAARMARLIDDLLDASRLDAGQLAIQPSPLDTGPFVEECIASQRHLAETAGIELRLEAQPALAPLWADRHRLAQVFENLVGNALKFTPARGRVVVQARMQGDELLFLVRDSGPGIPAEHLPHLFDRFWQARPAGRRGAGLGLTIAKGVVEAHGGRLWVESTPGHGACFCFTIPRADRREG